MKRRLLIFAIVCEMASLGWAINNKPDFSYFGKDIGIDAEGNLFVLTDDYDANLNGDFLTVKYSKEGRRLWERRFDGPIHGHETSSAIVVDGPGNVYVTGYVQLRETDPNDDYNVSARAFGYATIKYDKNGREMWAATYDESKDKLLRPEDIETDRFGNVYVLSSIEVNVPGSGPIDDFDKPVHFAVIKYDSAGKQAWAVRYGEPNDAQNYPSEAAVDEFGNVYVTGATSTLDLDGFNGFTTIKYDKSGQKVWSAKYVHGKGEYGSNQSLTIDEKGGIYILGYCSRSDKKFSDLITIKYDRTGRQEWMSRYREPGSKHVFPVDIGLDDDGNVYITGYADTPGRRPHGYDDIPIPQKVEFITVKYNAMGKEQWTAKYEGAKRRRGSINGFGLDRKRNVYIKGFIEHLQIRNKWFGIIIKYDEWGREEWVTYFEEISESAKMLQPSYRPMPDRVGEKWFETRSAAKKAALHSDIIKSSNLEVRDSNGYTLLERAVSEGYVDIAQMLISKGAKVTDGALCSAIMTGQAEAVKVLAQARGDITADNPCVFGALTWLEEPAVVKALLEAGLDVIVKDRNHSSLLKWPVLYGHTEIVKLLLDAGADPNARDSFGGPLVHEALRANDIEIFKAFIDAGVSVDIQNTSGQSLLESVVEENNTAIVRLLLDAGADVKREKQNGAALLFEAIRADNLEMVKLLIGAGVDPSAREEDGSTSIHESIVNSSKRVLLYLLDKGIDPNAKDNYGRTPLQKAIKWNNRDIAEILRKYGAKE
jgi:ankyrin repeat protein